MESKPEPPLIVSPVYVIVTLAFRLSPFVKLPALLVFVAPAKITNWPVVSDASMRVNEEWMVVGDAAVAAMSVTTPSPLLAWPVELIPRRNCSEAKIAERLGDRVDRRRANAAFMQAVRAAEEVARYRQAQLSAIKLAGDINAKVTDSASLDELITKLKGEVEKLKPILGPIVG
jgi:hypothetical protein